MDEAIVPTDSEHEKKAGRVAPNAEFALRWEVVAVLFVAVFPNISWNFLSYYAPQSVSWSEQVPYGIYALYSCCAIACKIVPVMYLIWRSGERWASFGLVRPRRADILLALLALVLDVLLHKLLPIRHLTGPAPFRPRPQQEADYVLMTLMYALGAFEQELIFRGYLITRLKRVFGSAAAALACSVLLFALVHRDVGTAYSAALAGIVYGIIYLWVPRIWPVALGHFLYNAAIDFRVMP